MTQFSEITPIGYNSKRMKFVLRDNEHTPYNSHKGEKEATCKVEIVDNKDNQWLEITVSEFVTGQKGRVVEKTISVCIDNEDREKLLQYLLK